jgi:hypothetical protein
VMLDHEALFAEYNASGLVRLVTSSPGNPTLVINVDTAPGVRILEEILSRVRAVVLLGWQDEFMGCVQLCTWSFPRRWGGPGLVQEGCCIRSTLNPVPRITCIGHSAFTLIIAFRLTLQSLSLHASHCACCIMAECTCKKQVAQAISPFLPTLHWFASSVLPLT